MKYINFLSLLFLLPLGLNAQYSIDVVMPETDIDTMLFGYFYGKSQFVLDTAYNVDNRFVFEDDEKGHNGMFFLYVPNRGTVQFMIDNQVKYNINLDEEMKATFANSPQNSAFYGYIDFITEQRVKLNDAETGGMDSLQLAKFRESIDKEVYSYQERLVEQYQDSMLAVVINLNRNVEVPDFSEAGEDENEMRYRYLYDHFFDFMDLKDNRYIYAPGFYSRVKQFVDNYTVMTADSIIKSVDIVLNKTDLEGPNYRYLLVDFLNSYAAAEVIGLDAVYVYLIQNYYAKGLAPWVNEKQLDKLVKNAEKLENILIGKKAPELSMKLKDGKTLALKDVESDLVVLAFWTPECGHCRKAIPALAKEMEEFRGKSVKVFAVCTELMDEVDKCWEFIEEHPEMAEFINVTDPYLRSNFKEKYDIFATPKFFLLDSNKEILLKNFSTEQLPDILNHFLSTGK